MSNIFEVPCPECGGRLSIADKGGLKCPACQRTYQSRMGHLFPAAEPRSSTITAPATTSAATADS